VVKIGGFCPAFSDWTVSAQVPRVFFSSSSWNPMFDEFPIGKKVFLYQNEGNVVPQNGNLEVIKIVVQPTITAFF
jgi:hypothetical protein